MKRDRRTEFVWCSDDFEWSILRRDVSMLLAPAELEP
jgi:hypothetical protein